VNIYKKKENKWANMHSLTSRKKKKKVAQKYKKKTKKKKKKMNHTRNVSRLVIVNTELTFVVVDDVLLFPIILSIVNEVFDF